MRDKDLLDLIYEAGVGAQNWDDVLRVVMERADGVSALFPIVYSDQSAQAQQIGRAQRLVLYAVGVDDRDLDEYYRDFAIHNFRQKRIRRMPHGSMLVDGRDFALSDINSSVIQNEFHYPHGRGYCLMAKLVAFNNMDVNLSIHRKIGAGGFDQSTIDSVKEIVPHLSRSLMIHGRVTLAEERARGLSLAIDNLQAAMIIVNDKCKVVSINRAAEEILRQPDSPLRIRHDILTATRMSDTGLIQLAVSEASAALRSLRGKHSRVVEIRQSKGKGGINMLALPLIEASLISDASGAHVLLFLSDPRGKIRLSNFILLQEFNLTPAEARVGALLCAGLSVEDIAKLREVSFETIRVQVKALLRKTQTHSQGQLVAMLAKSLAGSLLLSATAEMDDDIQM